MCQCKFILCMQTRSSIAHYATDKYYMVRMTSVEQTLYQLNPTRQELDWIKQHAQWLDDTKMRFKLGSPQGIMCLMRLWNNALLARVMDLRPINHQQR